MASLHHLRNTSAPDKRIINIVSVHVLMNDKYDY